jgi:hypothetical protein
MIFDIKFELATYYKDNPLSSSLPPAMILASCFPAVK